ncbi:PaaI family thioesterase [uncultured Bilophila sp.]|uniref:PaaI family thioesterase n=1 Tax=uncultured Bilophila sp. TaxID=529385 RepID=UPI0026DD57A4|nr:PaaI family thioesterase [uncultured Bilophila sp.]
MSQSVQAIKAFLETHDHFVAHNGITIEDADYDYGKVSLALDEHVTNSLGMLHGGAMFTLADMAFGLAANFDQEDGTMISTNATISYMKSAKTGPIVAEARLANGGRHLATYEVKIYDGQGTYIACAMISGYRLDTKLDIEKK